MDIRPFGAPIGITAVCYIQWIASSAILIHDGLYSHRYHEYWAFSMLSIHVLKNTFADVAGGNTVTQKLSEHLISNQSTAPGS